jgi:hypothetical protein
MLATWSQRDLRNVLDKHVSLVEEKRASVRANNLYAALVFGCASHATTMDSLCNRYWLSRAINIQ